MKSINFSALKLLATTYEVGSIEYRRRIATASLANSPSGRYRWTKERDELLVKLVANKGKRTWADIAKQLGIAGDPGKVRSRWRVLQPKEHSMWTKSEDQELYEAIKSYIRAGNVFGRYGMWVHIAKQLTTNRSPQQCQSRWKNTLLPLQGKIVECTRFEHIRGWSWQAEEQQRLENAINQIEDVQGSTQELLLASQKEPWLVPDNPTQGNRVTQFWTYVASRVKTRTPMQCRRKWESLLQARESKDMTIKDARRLAELVKSCGTKWKLLASNYFPGKPPNKLYTVYCYWKQLESRYNVDLLQIDPFARLQGYDGYSAWRPTGKDGFYDPSGQLVQVRYTGKRSVLLPYVLACMRVGPKLSKRRSRLVGFYSQNALSSRLASPETIDKLVAALAAYGNDWVSVSRSLNMPTPVCRKLADDLSTRLPIIRQYIRNTELDSLMSKHSTAQQSASKAAGKS